MINFLKPTRRIFVFTRNCTCVTRRQPFSSATTTTTTTEKTEISTPDTSPTANDDDETKQTEQGQTRMEQLAAFRKFQEVANDMKWPAQNVREQLDKVEDIPDFVPMSFGEPDATDHHRNEDEQGDDDQHPEEEEADKLDYDAAEQVDWEETFPANYRLTEKSFGVKIHDNISERDAVTLSLFVNELGRIQPRHLTGLSAKQQRKVAKTIKKARHMGILPHTFRLPPDYAYLSPVQSPVPAQVMDDLIPKFDQIVEGLTSTEKEQSKG